MITALSYHLKTPKETIRTQLRQMSADCAVSERTHTRALEAFLREEEEFLAHTNGDTVQNEGIIPEHPPAMDILNAPRTVLIRIEKTCR